MALRDQPYLPLYVQDFLTDEKLIECSASATGIYIRLLCIMHKSEPYGTILLKQKDKQTNKQIKNFATKLLKHLPYSVEEIEIGLTELISEGVIQINGESLSQKRMIQDNKLSNIRAEAGKKGGFASGFAKANIKAKGIANTEYENEYDIAIVNEIISYLNFKTKKNFQSKTDKTKKQIKARLNEGFKIDDFKKVIDNRCIKWLSDPKMNEYLRPETLFGTKFESYLNDSCKIIDNGFQP